MKLFLLWLVAGCAFSAPVDDDNNNIIVTKEFFPEELAIYTAQNDIVKILVPLNKINFNDDDDTSDDKESTDVALFFIEGDIKDNGDVENKGLYKLKNKKATKILDNANDFAAPHGDTTTVYFATNDGIYTYNEEKNKAEKYGSVTERVISIAVANATNALYVLTEDKTLYRVTEDGNKKVKIADVNNAEQIMIDYSDNLYYFAADKVPYVVSDGGIKKIEGLPQNPSKVLFTRPPFILENGIPFISDNKVYFIYANGTFEYTDFELSVRPTAFAPEATLLQYYAYEKKIYEYNMLALILGGLIEELKNFLDTVKDDVRSLSTLSRNEFLPAGLLH